MTLELRISNLSKTYDNGVKALDDVSLTIPTRLFGLLARTAPGSDQSPSSPATIGAHETFRVHAVPRAGLRLRAGHSGAGDHRLVRVSG